MKKVYGKILLIVLPIIAAVLLLYPTYNANELIDLQEKALAKAEQAEKSTDSLAIMEEFEKQYGEELVSAKQNRLKLGLDLRGGMYVTLEIDVLKLIEEAAQNDAIDDVFMQVLEKTAEEIKISDEAVIDVFKRYFDEIAGPKKRYLSDYFTFADEGDLEDIDDNIIEKLKENETEAIDRSIEIIRQRVDKYGIAEPTIQKVGTTRILLELPGVNKEEEMRQLLQTTARLEFNLVKNNKDLIRAFYKIDQLLANENRLKAEKEGTETAVNQEIDTNLTAQPDQTPEQIASADTTSEQISDTNEVQIADTAVAEEAGAEVAEQDSLEAAEADTANPYAGLTEDETRKRYLEDHPFSTLFDTYYTPSGQDRAQPQRVNYAVDAFPEGDYTFEIFDEIWDKFNVIISRPDVRELLPDDIIILRNAKPRVINDPNSGRQYNLYNFYALEDEPKLTGEVITDAMATYDPTSNQPIVIMRMNSDGSERWANITGQNIKKRIAIILDGLVYSAPTVQDKIVGGSSQITGMDSPEEAQLLKIVLKAGALKAPVKIIEERIVGPSLGEDSITSGFNASLIAFILVILYMILYYRSAGIIADFALLLNVVLIISVLAAFKGTLTLPGIAGIILTIGMAVDANILIFERIREELFKGRSLRSAVDEGFSKALSAILDSNITTGITGIILFFFGTGPIQGFALTLIIGIFGTLFTGIMISRALIEISLARGASAFNFGQPKEISQQS